MMMSEQNQNVNKITVYKRDKWTSGSYFKQFVFAIDLSNGQSLPVWRILKVDWSDKYNNKEHVMATVGRELMVKLRGYLLKDIAIMFSSKTGKKRVSVKYYGVSPEGMVEGLKVRKEKIDDKWYDVVLIDDKKVKISKDKIEIERFTT